MGNNEIREPIQKRSIEKKNKIINAGFELICDKGYYNTNTAEIAKAAGVSTGIVYQYFKDKHDIFIEGINLYADSIFYPMLEAIETNFNKDELNKILNSMIVKFIENHKLSQTAHEEITAMAHSDKDVALAFQKSEITMTNKLVKLLIDNGFESNCLHEKVHISINLIDDLCHEIVYHKHQNMNYEVMTKLVVDTVCNLLSDNA